MKVENSSGREYYLQRSKDNFMAKWCSIVTPSRIDLDGTTVEAFGDVEKSNYIYLVFEETTYCLWAKDPRNFEFLEETSLRITDRGRPRSGTKKASNDQPPRVVGRSPKIQMGKEDELPTREDLEAVLLHLPRLREQVEARAGDPDAAEGLYSETFSSAVRKVVKALFQHRFMFPFNYQPWMDEARKLEENHELLAQADLETLRKLVVVHWRQDYWDYDHTHWESVAANWHLVKLVERLREIAEVMEPQTKPSVGKFTSDEGNTARLPEEDSEERNFAIAKTNKNQKWTHELRVKMYSRLLAEFGPHTDWGTFAYPSGRKDRLKEVLKELAEEFTRSTVKTFEWTALDQQMIWGITRQGRVKNAAFASQYILNKAAALETGFLKTSELSGFVHLQTDIAEPNEQQVDPMASEQGDEFENSDRSEIE
ncbi:MAG TPA: DUF6508 domain-containing protein [Pyrinomonadaceae bacterium]|nr:DUF6508 domain-containing protein [Pyrinomonadaceae bacterium]HMP64049.1 DUF6508 domain-containing protein [Pyrinomonadaceae bacterium]